MPEAIRLRIAAEGGCAGQSLEPRGISVEPRDVELWLFCRPSTIPGILGPIEFEPHRKEAVQLACEQILHMRQAQGDLQGSHGARVTADADPLFPPSVRVARANAEVRAGERLNEAVETLEGCLQAGLEQRLDGFVSDFGGGPVYAALRTAGVTCATVRVCHCCGWVFAASRKRTAQLCYRCGRQKMTPPAPSTRATPLFDLKSGRLIDWERVELKQCSCGRLFADVRRMSQRGRPRQSCRNCSTPKRVYAFVAADGSSDVAVSFLRPDGTNVRLRAVDGRLVTQDAEDAGVLERMDTLKSVRALGFPGTAA